MNRQSAEDKSTRSMRLLWRNKSASKPKRQSRTDDPEQINLFKFDHVLRQLSKKDISATESSEKVVEHPSVKSKHKFGVPDPGFNAKQNGKFAEANKLMNTALRKSSSSD